MNKPISLFHILCLMLVIGCSQAKDANKSRKSIGAINNGIFTAKVGLAGSVEVGVVGPTGQFLFLVRDDLHCPGVRYSNGVLSIETTRALGVLWRGETPVGRFAFDKKGNYKVFVSNNLETEIENSYARTFSVNLDKNIARRKNNFAKLDVASCMRFP